MELDQLWPKADYITVHTPLIPQTKGRCHQEVIIIIIIIIMIIMIIIIIIIIIIMIIIMIMVC